MSRGGPAFCWRWRSCWGHEPSCPAHTVAMGVITYGGRTAVSPRSAPAEAARQDAPGGCAAGGGGRADPAVFPAPVLPAAAGDPHHGGEPGHQSDHRRAERRGG